MIYFSRLIYPDITIEDSYLKKLVPFFLPQQQENGRLGFYA